MITNIKTEKYTVYAKEYDMTFIIEEETHYDSGVKTDLFTRCVGWHYGKPDDDSLIKDYGLEAHYDEIIGEKVK